MTSSDAGVTSSSISSPTAPSPMPTLSPAPSLTLSPVSTTSDNLIHRPFAGALLRSAAEHAEAAPSIAPRPLLPHWLRMAAASLPLPRQRRAQGASRRSGEAPLRQHRDGRHAEPAHTRRLFPAVR